MCFSEVEELYGRIIKTTHRIGVCRLREFHIRATSLAPSTLLIVQDQAVLMFRDRPTCLFSIHLLTDRDGRYCS